jgi:hypothetical protein
LAAANGEPANGCGGSHPRCTRGHHRGAAAPSRDVTAHGGNRRRRSRSFLDALEDEERRADLDLVAWAELALVDARTVHHGARLVAQIDERDVVLHLDDRVHARRKLVVDPQMTLWIFADLDDVLRDRLTTNELVTLIKRESER